MVDSPHHPEMDVIFALGEAGVIDPDDDGKKKKKTTKKAITESNSENSVDSEPDPE